MQVGVLRCLQSHHHLIDVLLEDLGVADLGLLLSLGLGEGSVGVDELASEAVGTEHVVLVLLAELGLVLGGDVLLLEEFKPSMGE
ncbi:MAG: hypothetical protein ACMG6E_08020 [Candidatus Roizmanbacteria bacterium]